MNGSAPHLEDVLGTVDRGLWRRIARHAVAYKGAASGMIIGGILIAIVEALLPFIIGVLVDSVIDGSNTSKIVWLSLAYVFCCIAFCVLVWCFIVAAGKLATGMAHDLRRASFRRLQELESAYFDLQPAGWLVSRLTSDCRKVSSLMPWFLLDVCWGITFLGLVGVGMLLIDFVLGLCVMAVVPFLVIVTGYFQSRLLKSSRLMRKTNSELTAVYNEGITGIRTTKSLSREQANATEFMAVSRSMRDYSMLNAIETSIFLPIVTTLGGLGVGIALWVGGLQIQEGDGISIGMLIAFMQYAVLFSMPVRELAARLSDLKGAEAAAERIQGLLEREPAIGDSAEVQARIDAAGIEPGSSLADDGGVSQIETIEFNDVSFWYKREEPVLSRFNLAINHGETIALVGPTGGGKTTIASLLCRFYEPNEGSILYNGVDYRKRSLHWLQSSLGIVLQDPHLFSGSVARNIAYGKPDAGIDEIKAAARLVEADDFINRLPNGYDTEVGEGGSRLSVGQRQLVALARAILKDPQVFVMDEATSSVDTHTEYQIQKGIEATLSGRIAVVIAHRLSTIRTADRILVIDQGRILEQGSHDELLAAGGAYRDLYKRHFVDPS